MKKTEEETKNWYKEYYRKKGAHRNYLLQNREVVFQSLAHDLSILSILRSIDVGPETAKVLDVGCGTGDSLLNFLKVGFDSALLTGIDVNEERISAGKKRFPGMNLMHCDASDMDFEDETFDIVFASTMFVQLTDDELASKIASEMIRVCKTNSYICLVDWRYSKPWDNSYKGLSAKRIKNLFYVDTKTVVFERCRGPLVPPLGRFISKRIPSIYFLLHTLFPFLAGQVATALQKTRND